MKQFDIKTHPSPAAIYGGVAQLVEQLWKKVHPVIEAEPRGFGLFLFYVYHYRYGMITNKLKSVIYEENYKMTVTILHGDCRVVLPTLSDCSVQCCVTSPPYYGLRDYGVDGQIGLEQTPDEYVAQMVAVFREVRRVLRDDGVLFLNLGDSYANRNYYQESKIGSKVPVDCKPKDLIGIPWMMAFALRKDGWYIRSDVIWEKPNVMPSSVKDRPTSSYEHVFMLAKSERYFYDADAIREGFSSVYSQDAITKAGKAGGQRPAGNNFDKETRHITGIKTPSTRAERAALLNPAGRNCRDVWKINTKPCREAHFAVMPTELAEKCIKAGTSEYGCCSLCGSSFNRVVEGGLTVDWKQSCKCENVTVIPCVVIDPFGGSGTTALAAQNVKRDSVLIELNPDYIEIAERRVKPANSSSGQI